jgi:hypothetical protein
MKPIVLLLLTAMASFAADDSWAKVRELKRGVELRVYTANTKEPIRATFDQASDESLIVITKDGQLSILKDDIERVDRRREPPRPIVKETQVDRKIAAKGAEVTSNTIPGATTSVKTRVDIPSKSAFETIYDRKPVK